MLPYPHLKYRLTCSSIILKGEHVHIYVGSEKACFSFPRDLLSAHSTKFAEHLKDNSGPVYLPEWHPGQFRIFAYWVLYQYVPEKHAQWWMVWGTKPGCNTKPVCLVPRLLACEFACAFGIKGLKNACYNSFVTAAHGENMGPDVEEIVYAYEKFPTNIRLLNFLVELHVWHSTITRNNPAGRLASRAHELPRAFQDHILVKIDQLVNSNKFKELQWPCAYHFHENDEIKALCPAHKVQVHKTRSGFKVIGEGISIILADLSIAASKQLADYMRNLANKVDQCDEYPRLVGPMPDGVENDSISDDGMDCDWVRLSATHKFVLLS